MLSLGNSLPKDFLSSHRRSQVFGARFFFVVFVSRFSWNTSFIFLSHLIFASPGLADPFGTDKVAHFGLSSVLVQTAMRGTMLVTGDPNISFGNRFGSSAVTFGVGLAKEFYDRQHGTPFSGIDLAADGLGVLTGNFLLWEF